MPAPPLTTREYFRTPETLGPQELIWGLVRDAAAPTPRHQSAVGELFFHLRTHLQREGSGRVWMSPIDVVLDATRDLVVQPDLIVTLNDRDHLVTDRVWGAPNLVIEVLSPRPRIGTLDERLAWFARYDVQECWLVHDLRQEVEVINFAAGEIATRREFEAADPIDSTVLPGFRMTPAKILEDVRA